MFNIFPLQTCFTPNQSTSMPTLNMVCFEFIPFLTLSSLQQNILHSFCCVLVLWTLLTSMLSFLFLTSKLFKKSSCGDWKFTLQGLGFNFLYHRTLSYKLPLSPPKPVHSANRPIRSLHNLVLEKYDTAAMILNFILLQRLPFTIFELNVI